MEKLTLLLDGDVFAYQAAVQSQTEIVWDEDTATQSADFAEAKERLDSRLQWVMEKLNGTDMIIALSDNSGLGYWRRKILPSYKMNRAGQRRPILLKELRQYLHDNYPCKMKPELEGDDVLGILATHPTLVPGRKYIVSEDKDMKTIPATFARIDRKNHKIDIQTYTEAEATYFHMLQTLTGDTSDGYKGCPKVGPKTAQRVLEALSNDAAGMWVAVRLLYEKAGLTEADALVQARVARILRSTDYDYKTKQPILWTPPTIKKGINGEIKTDSKERGADPQQGTKQEPATAAKAG